MPKKPQLFLVRRPPLRPEQTPLYADEDRTRLWEMARNRSIHLLLREPSLLELARRRDPDLFSFCDSLLKSQGDDWALAVKAIAALGTSKALEKLIMIFAGCLRDDRFLIIDLVAKSLTAEYIRPFSIMVRHLAKPGEIDICGWTKAAVATLQDVCKRYGIETYIEGQSMSTRDPHAVHTEDFKPIVQ